MPSNKDRALNYGTGFFGILIALALIIGTLIYTFFVKTPADLEPAAVKVDSNVGEEYSIPPPGSGAFPDHPPPENMVPTYPPPGT